MSPLFSRELNDTSVRFLVIVTKGPTCNSHGQRPWLIVAESIIRSPNGRAPLGLNKNFRCRRSQGLKAPWLLQVGPLAHMCI